MGNQAGTSPLPINLFSSPLAVNGGVTLTHALQPRSPAIDSGNSFGLTNDQTGRTHPIDLVNCVNTADGSDIDAYELTMATELVKALGLPRRSLHGRTNSQ